MKRVCICLIGMIVLCADVAANEVPRCVCRRPKMWAASVSEAGAMPRQASVAASEETNLDVIDVLLAFDESAVGWIRDNGKGTVLEYARSCIDKMNECLEKSNMLDAFRFRLAGTVNIAQNLSGRDLGSVLDLFLDDYGRDVSTGVCKVVPAARETYGADVVSILVANGRTGTIGLGYSLMDSDLFPFSSQPAQIVSFAPWAYSACSIEAVDEDYTLVHEVGHNMGAGHPDATCSDVGVYEENLGPQLYDYSSGYYFWIGDTGYYTVMAYNYGGLDAAGQANSKLRFEQVPCFSSPNVLYEGTPVGTSVNDNRKTLLSTYRYVAQFRASKIADEEESTAITIAGFSVEGAFRPAKALNGEAPYVGVAYSNDVPVATVQLKIGKPNAKTGLCKISGTILGITGTKYTLKVLSVSTGSEPQWATGMVVPKFGTLDLVLGDNGFAGTCAASPFGALEIRTQTLGTGLTSNPAIFRMDSVDTLDNLPVITNCLPDRTSITVGKKWTFAKATTVKYAKVKGSSPARYELVLDEGKQGDKTNRSGLKLTYTANTSSFKGSFTFFLRAGTEAKPKIKKVKATVTGLVVGGCGAGLAVVKGRGSWPVTIE